MIVRLWGTAIFGGYVLYMCWVISIAVRGGPNWRSGREGDLIRFPRAFVIVGSAVGVVIGLAILAFCWLYPGWG